MDAPHCVARATDVKVMIPVNERMDQSLESGE